MLETEVLCVVVTDLSVQDGMQKTLKAEIRRRHKAEEELRASHAQLEEAYEKLVKETKARKTWRTSSASLRRWRLWDPRGRHRP